jgi:pilus assembly protein CpaB
MTLVLKNRRILNGGIALLLGVVTVGVTQQWLQRETSRLGASALAQAPESSLRILVAARSLPPGTILEPSDLTWQAWPSGGNADAYYAEAGTNPGDLVGAVVRNGLALGEPLTREGVVRPGDRSFLAAVLKPGYRAVSIAVTASTGVSGFIRPGDRVDVILSRMNQNSNSQSVSTVTILTGIRIVGIDQRAATETTEVIVPQTTTLEVTPTQAEAIAAASELGKLSLALRSIAAPGDDHAEGLAVSPFWRGEASPHTASAKAVAAVSRSNAEPAARTQVAARGDTVEIVRGMTSSIEGFGQ